jgi:hypothetical protein
MFDGIKNSFKNTKQSTIEAKDTVVDMVKGVPNLPWKKLPALGWMYIIFAAVVFLLIIFVLVPLIDQISF